MSVDGSWDSIIAEAEVIVAEKGNLKAFAEEEGVNYNTLRSRMSRARNTVTADPTGFDPRPRFPDAQWPEDLHWEDAFDLWHAVNESHVQIDPIIETVTCDLSHVKKDIAIVSGSDFHMGGGFTNHKKLKKTMRFIIDNNMYLGLTGDIIEGFIAGDKPAETQEQMPSSVKAQRSVYRTLVRDLGWRLLWMGWGDHDAKWFEKLIGENVIKSDFHDKVPYFQGRGVMRLLLGSEEYFIQFNHAEMFNSQWNPNHPNRRQVDKYFPADVNITGHRHKPAIQMFHHYDMLRDMGINLGGEIWLIQNGTFKTGPDVYSIRGWSRGVYGCPTILLSHKGHDVSVQKSPELGLRFLQSA
jgi:hypothetical protein